MSSITDLGGHSNSVSRFLHRFTTGAESWIGVIVSLGMSLSLIVGSLIEVVDALNQWGSTGVAIRLLIAGIVFLLALIMDGYFTIVITVRLIRSEHPVALHVTTYMWPFLRRTRWIGSWWWFAHFCGAAFILFLIESAIGREGFGYTFPLIFGFGMAYALNVFLLMAMAGSCKVRDRVLAIWRWRLLIDCLVAIGCLLIHVLHLEPP